MSRIFTFNDQVKLARPKIYTDAQELVNDIFSVGGNPGRVALRTRIRATHSGYLLNQRVYPGVFVERSAPSWVSTERGGTASYDKPVILNHDQTDATQTIGRVRGFQFTRLKEGNDFLYDFKRPAQGRDMGSGHIMLDALITDPDAIQKILDGRYDTVSTGQRPKAARCNICGFDWINYDPWEPDCEVCEHRPGKTYQIDDRDIPCFLVTGDLEYRECSYVTVPAQPNARTLQANLESLQTFASKDSEDRELFFNSFEDNVPVEKVELFNADGTKLSLMLNDGDEDVLPDIATRFTKPAVFFPSQEDDMKKNKKLTTDEADSILDSWIEDAQKRAGASKDDANTADDVNDEGAEGESDENVDTNDSAPVADKKDTDSRISDSAMKEVIDTVRGERDSLKAEKEGLESKLDEKSQLIDTLTSQIAELRGAQVTDAARTLAIIRMITGQTDANDTESFNEAVNELSKRSIDSLSDSISDSLPVLNDSLKNLRRNTQVIREVENPTLQHKDTDQNAKGGSDVKKELMDKDEFLSSL